VENSRKPVAPLDSEPPSRIIEYFPPGPTVTGRDCVYQSNKYSMGARIKMDDGAIYECTGDGKGTWEKVSK
jgi:hypothetical protein